MAANNHKTLLRNYLEQVWKNKQPETIRNFLAPHYKRYTSPTAPPLSLEDQIQRLASFWAAFPDIQIQVEEVAAEDGLICFRSTMRGTHQGTFHGLPPSGRRVAVQLLDMIKIENGQFVEHWGGPDLYDLLQQLGDTGP
jgi:steroid delta-isomerase-like uncharacterized protein